MNRTKYHNLVLKQDKDGTQSFIEPTKKRKRRMSHASSYKLVLAVSLFLLFAGLVLTAFSLFSAQWQVSEIGEQHVTHLHGLWKDCIEPSKELIPLYENSARQEKCVYKFDPSAQEELRKALDIGDEASHELLLHRFLPQHKAVIFFAVFTFVFGLLGSIIGICSPCFPPNSMLFVVALFLTTACSILADVIFIAAAMKPPQIKWEKFDKFDPSKYENKLGMAAFLHLLASGLITTSFFSSLGTAYLLLLTRSKNDGSSCCSGMRPKRDFEEEDRWHGPGLIIRACDDQACKPFVIMPDPQSDDSAP
ncbi:unnamed protein product, partial [Mesorhabditis belari]|uniref:Uncharacterized protein n=1 Tax=Mesorhabditis belari TaxID=2138241 RepID=A0AAF3FRK9_9BILA